MAMLARIWLQGLTLPQFQAHLEIAALAGGAGEDQVAQARQAGEGHGVGPQPQPQADHLGQAPGDEGGPGVVPSPMPSRMPVPMAKMFFSEPPNSTPVTSWPV